MAYQVQFGQDSFGTLMYLGLRRFMHKNENFCHGNVLESWQGVTVMSEAFQDIPSKIQNEIAAASNWIFYMIFAGFFGIWYLGLRRIIIKTKTFA